MAFKQNNKIGQQQSYGGSAASRSEDEGFADGQGGGRVVQWVEHQKKLELIDVLEKEKSLLEFELDQVRKQLDGRTSSQNTTVERLTQRLSEAGGMNLDLVTRVQNMTTDLEQTKD